MATLVFEGLWNFIKFQAWGFTGLLIVQFHAYNAPTPFPPPEYHIAPPSSPFPILLHRKSIILHLLHLLFYHSQPRVNLVLEASSQILLSLVICSSLIMLLFDHPYKRGHSVSVLLKLRSVSFWVISVYPQDLFLPAQGSFLAGFGGPCEVLRIIVCLTACKANALLAVLFLLSLKDCIHYRFPN